MAKNEKKKKKRKTFFLERKMNADVWNFAKNVFSLARDRELVAVGLGKGEFEIRNVHSGTQVWARKAHLLAVECLLFTRNRDLVTGSQNGVLKRWVTESGVVMWSKKLQAGQTFGLAELSDGRLVSGCVDGTIRMIHGGTGQEIMSCEGHTDWVNAVVTLRDCFFASGSSDGTIRFWAGDGTLMRVLEVRDKVFSLATSPCSQSLFVGCYNGKISQFRLPYGDLVWAIHTGSCTSITLCPNGRFLASGSEEKAVRILCAETGATLRTLMGHTSWVHSVLFNEEGTKVLSGSQDNTVRVWRIFLRMERRVRALFAASVADEDVLHAVWNRLTRLYEIE